MTTRQRKILVFAFVIGSVLAAAVDIASACPPSGGKRRSSGGGLYSQSNSGRNQQYAKSRRQMTPPPAPPAQMITNEYQLASSKVPVNKLPANTLTAAAAEPASDEVFENPFAASDTASGAAEAKARQLRQQAALEQVWRAEQATARDTASAGSTAQVDAAMHD